MFQSFPFPLFVIRRRLAICYGGLLAPHKGSSIVPFSLQRQPPALTISLTILPISTTGTLLNTRILNRGSQDTSHSYMQKSTLQSTHQSHPPPSPRTPPQTILKPSQSHRTFFTLPERAALFGIRLVTTETGMLKLTNPRSFCIILHSHSV